MAQQDWKRLSVLAISILAGMAAILWLQTGPVHAAASPQSSQDEQNIATGIKAYQQEDWKRAIKALKPLLEQAGPLPDYILFMVGRSELATSQCKEAVPRFQQLRSRYPQSIYANSAQLYQAQALLCAKRPAEARQQAQSFLKAKPQEHEREEARLLIARTYMKEGATAQAITRLKSFWTDATSEQLAESALSDLKKLGVQPNRTEKFRRAHHLYKQREWALTKDLLVEIGDQDSFMFAECVFRLRDYPRAKKLFQNLLERGDKSAKVLARIATIEARTGNYESAIAYNRKLTSKNRGSSQQKAALKKIAFLHKDSFQFDEAAIVLRELLAKPLRRKERINTLTELAWVSYRAGHYEASITILDKLIKTPRAHKKHGQFLYWQGQIYNKWAEQADDEALKQERQGKASEAFSSAWDADKWDYYGMAALRELHNEPKDYLLALRTEDQKRQRRIRHVAVAADPPTDGLFHLSRALILTELGFKRLAADEMRQAYTEAKRDPALVKKVGTVSYEVGNYYVPMVVALNQPGLLDRPEQTWHWIYPEAYRSTVERHSKRRKIDPRLVYSMMRQESAFQEEVISSAGARGLIQIMPFTGKRLANEMGWQGFKVQDLFEPEINIALSTLYMRMNGDLFENRLPMVIASYNAGEAAVERWLPSRVELADWEFIEEIPYRETNKYTKKVMRNYWMYQYLYPNGEWDKKNKPAKKNLRVKT